MITKQSPIMKALLGEGDMHRPWAKGSFELLVHAEEHYLKETDTDRLLSLISFDNAIEIALRTYLYLHPSQRNGETYEKTEILTWERSFESMLEFFFNKVISARGVKYLVADKPTILYYHQKRNTLYHEAGYSPRLDDLKQYRDVAFWIFFTLFQATIEKVVKSVSDKVSEIRSNDLKIPKSIKENAIQSKLRDFTAKALASLPPREERVLRLHFGIGVAFSHSVDEIARTFNVSQKEIQEIISSGLRNIAKNGIKNEPTT